MAQFSRKFSCGENAQHLTKYGINHVEGIAKTLSEPLCDISAVCRYLYRAGVQHQRPTGVEMEDVLAVFILDITYCAVKPHAS